MFLIRCLNPLACNGNRRNLSRCTADADCAASGQYRDLQCSDGYHGNLCGMCAEGFGTVKPFSCRDCMPIWAIVALYAAATILMLGFLKLFCYFTLADNAAPTGERSSSSSSNSSSSSSSEDGVNDTAGDSRGDQGESGGDGHGHGKGNSVLSSTNVLRPLVLYMQYLLIIYSLNIPWPATLVYPLQTLAGLWSSASPQALSIECLLSPSSSIPIGIQRVLFYLLTPVAMAVLLLLIEAAFIIARRTCGRSGRAQPVTGNVDAAGRGFIKGLSIFN